MIGAGAAGLTAAYAAAKNGNSVVVFEKNEKCGKKIYITGKGRCNVTHDCTPQEFLENVVSNPKFLTSAIYSFSPNATMEFFENGGLHLKKERGARIFPVTDKASDVTKCLVNYCSEFNVDIKLNESTTKINLNSTSFDIITSKGEYTFDKVIVCTGGLSYPSTGSTGDGYKFASFFGHNLIPQKQGLCAVNLKRASELLKEAQGLSLKNVSLIIRYNDKIIKEFFGDMLFTQSGVSGPIVLSASSVINRLDLNKVKFIIDLKPALSSEQLDLRLVRDFDKNKNKNVYNCFRELLPSSLIYEVLRRSGVSAEKKVNSVTKDERAKLVGTVKGLDLEVLSLCGFEEAIITCGGVDVKEINPKTMESKLVKGLYFCGEVLDLDAYTGGYNLQIAFSTGYAAGNSIKE